MANIDRADWHYGGNYPADLPPENAGTHIGMYVAWIVSNALFSKKLETCCGASLQALRDRKITGRQLLFGHLDEKFVDSLLTKTGREFTTDYYETDAYLTDYEAALGEGLPSLYYVADTWANYDIIAQIVDDRFARWKRGEKPPPHAGELARREEEGRYVDAILEASRRTPAEAMAVLEAYIASCRVDVYRKMALRELDLMRAKHRTGGVGTPSF